MNLLHCEICLLFPLFIVKEICHIFNKFKSSAIIELKFKILEHRRILLFLNKSNEITSRYNFYTI